MLTPTELDEVTAWIREVYGAPAIIAGSAARTTGLALRVTAPTLTMWLRAGGVVQRSVELTELEGLVASELAASMPVAIPVRRRDGNFAGALQLRGTSLPTIGYVEHRGAAAEKPNQIQATALGIALRQLHDAPVGDIAASLPMVEPLVDIDTRLTQVAEWLTDTQLRELTEIVHRSRQRVDVAHLPLTVCHGDVRYANVFFENDQPTLFDLEAIGLGPPCYDLACLWRRRVLETEFAVALPEDCLWLLRGYERTRELAAARWGLLPALAALRAFWTMTLPLHPNADWGEPYRSSAGYWEAHMAQIKWFGDVSRTVNGSV